MVMGQERGARKSHLHLQLVFRMIAPSSPEACTYLRGLIKTHLGMIWAQGHRVSVTLLKQVTPPPVPPPEPYPTPPPTVVALPALAD
jgi:hypothetical protein